MKGGKEGLERDDLERVKGKEGRRGVLEKDDWERVKGRSCFRCKQTLF